MDMDNLTIKDNIRKIRKARRLTQEEMANMLDISVTAYRDLEKGETNIVNANILKIADLLEMPTEEIFLGYRPIQAEGMHVEEIHAEYNGRIAVMERRIADLEKMVETLDEAVRTKNEIIAMLKKSLQHKQ